MVNGHLLILTGFLLAQDVVSSADSSGQRGDGGQWRIAAYLGGALTTPSDLKISQPARANVIRIDDVRFASRSFDGPVYYGIRGGYHASRIPLGIEAEFIHLKVYADTTRSAQTSGIRLGTSIDARLVLRDIVQQYSISHGVNLVLVNLAARYPIGRLSGHPRWLFVGRFGAGPTLPHTESTVDGQHQEQYELGRLAWQLAGGTELHLGRGLYLFSEYKFTRTRQKGTIHVGEAEALLRSHHGVFGLSYHFGH